jgi:hypothetical protein
MKRRILVVAALALVAIVPSAFAAGKGSSMLSLGLGQGSAPVADVFETGNGYVFPSSEPSISAGAQYWYLFSDDYAFTAAGQYVFGSQKWEPADAGDPEATKSLSGYKFRIGGDRVGKVGDRFTLYFGPGLEFASNQSTLELAGSPDIETGNSTFFGVNGRIGGIMMLSESMGISGEIGHSFGQASSEDDTDPAGTAKSTWTASDFSAFWGLTFAFGGSK